MSRVTLTQQVATLSESVAALMQLVATQATGQHATPSAVAEAVAPLAPPVKPKTASDELKEFVEAQGLAFARGGRTRLSTDALTAAVRVLRTGTPEILPVNAQLEKRHVVGLAIGRDGTEVITQYLYKPEDGEPAAE